MVAAHFVTSIRAGFARRSPGRTPSLAQRRSLRSAYVTLGGLRGLRPICPLPFVRVEVAFAEADALRRYLDQLVLVDVCDRLLERQAFWWRKPYGFVLRPTRAEVGQLLGLQGVDLEVLGLGVLADDHAFVDRLAGRDHQRAAVLERVERVSDRLAAGVGDQDAGLPPVDRALVR